MIAGNLIKAIEKLLCLPLLVRFCSAKQSPCNDSEERIHTRSHPISKRSIFIRSLNVIFEIMINIHTPIFEILTNIQTPFHYLQCMYKKKLREQ